jgi:hypothetical protein
MTAELLRLAFVEAILVPGICLLAVAVQHVRDSADRVSCNLGQVVHAIYRYQDEHGHLPPAVVRDRYGAPLYSWRVLLLPYIEEGELYKEFRLDEPWDSPHNIQLLPRRPRTYALPGTRASRIPPDHTQLRVFNGKGSAFEEGRKLKIPDDFRYASEDTFLFVEAGEPVPWTKPEALAYDPDEPLPDLRSFFRQGFRSCTIKGNYRFIPRDTSEEELRALISRHSGDLRD